MEAAQDSEEKFIFLWIAFNAAYGAVTIPLGGFYSGERESEKEKLESFFEKIVANDGQGRIRETLLDTYSGPIRVLMNNPFTFAPFWNAVQGLPQGENWKERFDSSNRQTFKAMVQGDTYGVLLQVFLRLYTLRNQIFHGGTTFRSGWGRDQVRDGSRIMAALVPAILEIMWTDIEEDPDSGSWGRVAYPRVPAELL